MSDDDPFIITWHDEVAHIELNRPRSLNALRGRDEEALANLITTAGDRARAVILSGAGERAFCAGADLREVGNETFASCLATLQREASLFDSILDCPAPVIAAVRGYALGLGLVITACCDVTIAAESAMFGMPELRNGVPAGMQTQIIAEHIGLARTRWLLLSGQHISAVEAREWGLIAQVCASDADPFKSALEFTDHIASLPPDGVRLQKRIFCSWLRDSFDANARGNPFLAASAYTTDDPSSSVDRFLTRKSGG